MPKRKRCTHDLKVDERSSPFGQCHSLQCKDKHWCSGCFQEAVFGCARCGKKRAPPATRFPCFYCHGCWKDHQKAFPRHKETIIKNSKV